MIRFNYTAVVESGKRVTGTLACQDRREAIRELLGRGQHPLSIRPAESNKKAVNQIAGRLFRRIGTADIAVFTRQLASLLKAGLPVTQAISTLRGQCHNKHLARIVGDIQQRLTRHAGTLADALDQYPRVFDSVYRGLVRAGEEGGNLVEVLNKLSDYLTRSAKVRGQVFGAFIYPIFILTMGIGAVFVLMSFVIPRFRELFTSFGQALPLPTKALIATSDFLAAWWWAVLAGIGIIILLIIQALRRPAFRRRADRYFLHLPILGAVFLKLEVSRISRTLGALLDNGVRILDALRITADAVRNLAIRALFPSILRDVRNGEALAASAGKSGIFPQMMINLIRTGENTGELPEMLSELSDIYEDEANRAVSGAVKLIEPILILLVGGVIAAIVAAVMLPVFRASAMVG